MIILLCGHGRLRLLLIPLWPIGLFTLLFEVRLFGERVRVSSGGVTADL
jgi:hypothetical protein